jgi:hypothetical protein
MRTGRSNQICERCADELDARNQENVKFGLHLSGSLMLDDELKEAWIEAYGGVTSRQTRMTDRISLAHHGSAQ